MSEETINEILQVVDSAIKSSQIGKSNSKASLQNQLHLKAAMEEAQRLNNKSSLPPIPPVELPESTASTILHVLQDIVETEEKPHETLAEPPILTLTANHNETVVKVSTTLCIITLYIYIFIYVDISVVCFYIYL